MALPVHHQLLNSPRDKIIKGSQKTPSGQVKKYAVLNWNEKLSTLIYNIKTFRQQREGYKKADDKAQRQGVAFQRHLKLQLHEFLAEQANCHIRSNYRVSKKKVNQFWSYGPRARTNIAWHQNSERYWIISEQKLYSEQLKSMRWHAFPILSVLWREAKVKRVGETNQRTPVNAHMFKNLLPIRAIISTLFLTKLAASSQIRWSGLSSLPSIFKSKYALLASKPSTSRSRKQTQHQLIIFTNERIFGNLIKIR